MPDDPGSSIAVMFARLEAKLDVALAQHGAKLDQHTEDIRDVRDQLKGHEERIRAGEIRPVITWKTLVWVIGVLAAVLAAVTPLLNKLYGG